MLGTTFLLNLKNCIFYFHNFFIMFTDDIRKDKHFNSVPGHEISTILAKWMTQATNNVNQKKQNKSSHLIKLE